MSEPLIPPPVEPLASWRNLVRGFGVLVIGEGVARMCGFVAILLMARRLDPDGFGLVTLGATLVLWFGIVVDSGTEVLNIRDIARAPERFKEIAEPVLGLRLVLSAGAVLLLAGAALIASSRPSDRYVLWLFALWLPMTALNLRWMVLGVKGGKSVALGNALGQLLFAGGVILLVMDVHDTLKVPLVHAAGEATYALVVLVAVGRRFGVVRPRVDLAKWRATLKESGPLMANQVARATVYSFDIFLVAVLIGRADVGFYGAAYKPVLFFSGALGLFYVSFLSQYSVLDAEHLRHLFRRTVLAAGAATLALATLLAAGAGLIVENMYGEQYAPAAAVLAVLIWTVPLLAVNGAYSNALIAGHRQRVLMRSNITGAAFNVLANAAAIPLFGIEGAAVVTVLSELIVLGMNYRGATRMDLAPTFAAILGRERVPALAQPTPR